MKVVKDTLIILIISILLFAAVVVGATRALYGHWPDFASSLNVYELSKVDQDTPRNREYYGDFHIDRLKYLGWASPVNRDHEIKRFHNGKKVWEIVAKIDERGFRYTPQEGVEKRKKHMIIMGDSNSFGEGLSDDLTIAAELARAYPDYRTYNLACGGYSSNQAYAIWQYENPSSWIKEEEGFLIYNFFFPQFGRVMGGAHDLRYSYGHAPRYVVENGELKHIGSFKDSPTFLLTSLFVDDLKWPAALFREFDLVPQKGIDLNVALLKGIKDKYMESFPKGKFIVYLMPAYGAYRDTNIRAMIQKLKEAGVDVYGADYNRPSPLSRKYAGNILNPKFFFEDGHINYEGVKIWAQDLDSILRPYMN